jgi:hypothetical protein
MKQKKVTTRPRAANSRQTPRSPPDPDRLSNVTTGELSSGDWAKTRGKRDPYQHVRTHPNAVAIRELRAKLAALCMPHRHPSKYFGEKDAYWDFQNCVKFGLNPYDCDKLELEKSRSQAWLQRQTEEIARWEREAEELRRNPPPPPPRRPAYRVVGSEPAIGSDAATRVSRLALHERYLKNWRPAPHARKTNPLLERYLIDLVPVRKYIAPRSHTTCALPPPPSPNPLPIQHRQHDDSNSSTIKSLLDSHCACSTCRGFTRSIMDPAEQPATSG